MWVTCYTDASFAGTRGAWAVWLRCEDGRLVRRGRCPDYVKDANSAELAAIFAGVHLAVATWGGRVRGVAVRSDSQTALALAKSGAELSRIPAYRRLQQKLRELVGAHGIELDSRWVRGHQPISNGTVAYLNGQCDKLAKRAREATRGRKRRKRKRKKARSAVTPGS